MSMATAKRTFSKPFDVRGLNRSIGWKLDIAAKQKRLADAVRSTAAERSGCPVCDEPRSAVFVEVFGYPYVECAACGHLYLQRPPSPEATRRLYASERGPGKSVQSDIYAVRELFETRVSAVATPKVEYVSRAVGAGGRWVDVGAGVGELVVAAGRRGWDAIGLEMDGEEVAFARQVGADVRQAEVHPGNAPALLGPAKVVSLLNVVEHAQDPAAVLATVGIGMEASAWLVVEVPRHPSLSSFAIRCFPEGAHRHIYPPDHLHVFTEKSLDILLGRTGFDAQHVWLFGQDYSEMAVSLACAGGRTGADIPGFVLDSADRLQAVVDEAGLSDTMFVVARRTAEPGKSGA